MEVAHPDMLAPYTALGNYYIQKELLQRCWNSQCRSGGCGIVQRTNATACDTWVDTAFSAYLAGVAACAVEPEESPDSKTA